jgi:hypothetical protein
MDKLRQTIEKAQEGNEEAKEALKILENFCKGIEEAVKQSI